MTMCISISLRLVHEYPVTNGRISTWYSERWDYSMNVKKQPLISQGWPGSRHARWRGRGQNRVWRNRDRLTKRVVETRKASWQAGCVQYGGDLSWVCSRRRASASATRGWWGQRWDERRVETVSTDIEVQKRGNASELPRYVLGQSHAVGAMVVGASPGWSCTYLGQTQWEELLWERETRKRRRYKADETENGKKPGYRGAMAMGERKGSSSPRSSTAPLAQAQGVEGAAVAAAAVSGCTL